MILTQECSKIKKENAGKIPKGESEFVKNIYRYFLEWISTHVCGENVV